MDLVAPLVAPALSQKPAFVTYFVARGAPRPCYIPEGFDSLPYNGNSYSTPKRLLIKGYLLNYLTTKLLFRHPHHARHKKTTDPAHRHKSPKT